MSRRSISLVPAILLLCLTVAAAQGYAQESTWRNTRGSTLNIEDVDSEGKITGFYINRAAGFPCQGTAYPVTGWVLERTNTITFTVKWENTTENCQSLTAWTGFFNSDVTQITTLWHLVANGTTSVGQIRRGQDVFTKVQQKMSSFTKQE